MPPYPRIKSEAQRRLMRLVEKSPQIARERGISQEVAKEFVRGDQGGKLPARVKKRPGK
jgi:hypothetical protein